MMETAHEEEIVTCSKIVVMHENRNKSQGRVFCMRLYVNSCLPATRFSPVTVLDMIQLVAAGENRCLISFIPVLWHLVLVHKYILT